MDKDSIPTPNKHPSNRLQDTCYKLDSPLSAVKQIMSSSGTPNGRRSSRARKKVEKLNYDEREEKKENAPEFSVPKGTGTCLRDLPRVADPKHGSLGKMSRNQGQYQVIHNLFYGRKMKRMQVKTNCLDFSGVVYDGKKMSREKQFAKVWKMNLSFLKDLCDYLDIDRSSTSFKDGKVDKESLSQRVVNWCEKPHAREGKTLEDAIPKKKKPKVKKKKKPKKPTKDPNAPKRALTSFMAYSAEWRDKVHNEMHELKFTEIASELGKRWKAMTDEQKKPYLDLAAKDKERYEDEMDSYVVPKEFRKRKKRGTKRKRASSAKGGPASLFPHSENMLSGPARSAPARKKKKAKASSSEQSESESEESESEESESDESSSEEEEEDQDIEGVATSKIIASIKKAVDGADLETLSVKKIRKGVEAEYSISLSAHKDRFKTMVSAILHAQ